MKQRVIYITLSLVLIILILSACKNEVPAPVSSSLETEKMTSISNPTITPLPIEIQMWQETYEDLLRESLGKDFVLCDIDCDETPELLIGGSTLYKYDHYDVYTYKDGSVKNIGEMNSTHGNGLWLGRNGGILGYDYGAGSGGRIRAYIENDILCFDGEVCGYYYVDEGILTEWFRGTDGSDIIVTEETEDEYQRFMDSMSLLEIYSINEDNIMTVIYDGTRS